MSRRSSLLLFAGFLTLAFATAMLAWLKPMVTEADVDVAVALSTMALLTLAVIPGVLFDFHRPALPRRMAGAVPVAEPVRARRGLGVRAGRRGQARTLLRLPAARRASAPVWMVLFRHTCRRLMAAQLAGLVRVGEEPAGWVAVVPPAVPAAAVAAVGGDPHSEMWPRGTNAGPTNDDDL